MSHEPWSWGSPRGARDPGSRRTTFVKNRQRFSSPGLSKAFVVMSWTLFWCKAGRPKFWSASCPTPSVWFPLWTSEVGDNWKPMKLGQGFLPVSPLMPHGAPVAANSGQSFRKKSTWFLLSRMDFSNRPGCLVRISTRQDYCLTLISKSSFSESCLAQGERLPAWLGLGSSVLSA